MCVRTAFFVMLFGKKTVVFGGGSEREVRRIGERRRAGESERNGLPLLDGVYVCFHFGSVFACVGSGGMVFRWRVKCRCECPVNSVHRS